MIWSFFMTIFEASAFKNRNELENRIREVVGSTETVKDDYSILGSRKELEKLLLSHNQIVWGIRVTATDPPEEPEHERPERGVRSESKLT